MVPSRAKFRWIYCRTLSFFPVSWSEFSIIIDTWSLVGVDIRVSEGSPEGLREGMPSTIPSLESAQADSTSVVFTTGGMPPLVDHPDDVYKALYGMLARSFWLP